MWNLLRYTMSGYCLHQPKVEMDKKKKECWCKSLVVDEYG